jgi:hypothetical protein
MALLRWIDVDSIVKEIGGYTAIIEKRDPFRRCPISHDALVLTFGRD